MDRLEAMKVLVAAGAFMAHRLLRVEGWTVNLAVAMCIPLIPAEAGIQGHCRRASRIPGLGPRIRADERQMCAAAD